MSWPILALRRVFRIVNGGTPTADEENWGDEVLWATPADFPGSFGEIRWTRRGLTRRGALTGSRIVPAGSILVSTRAPIGYVGLVSERMAFNQGCRALVPSDHTDTRYFGYQLSALTNVLQANGQGTTFLELSSDKLAEIPVTVPPLEEQRRIADFLDAETARIDKLVSMFRRARELLDERRSARRDGLLDHLRSDYGEIPLRRFMLRVDQGDSPQCDAVPRDVGEWGVLKLSAVKAGRFNPEENKRLPDDIPVNRANQIHAGDFLITRANTPSLVGDAAVAAGDVAGLLLPDLIYRVRLDRGANAEFMVQVVLGRRVRNLIEAVARGSSQSMVKLRGEDIKQWPIPRVGQRQQGEVVRMIHEASSETERLQHRIMRQIDLMSERRQALITAAVTGEFDVSAASGRGIEE